MEVEEQLPSYHQNFLSLNAQQRSVGTVMLGVQGEQSRQYQFIPLVREVVYDRLPQAASLEQVVAV